MQINRQTYEEFFLLYADGELNAIEKKEVEDFVEQNPDLAGEFELIGQTVMVPDESIIFTNKEILFRNEDNGKVVMMRWFRFAAAAVILIALSITGWFFLDENKNNIPPVAVLEPQKKTEPTRNEQETVAAPEIETATTVNEKPQVTVKQTENKSENKKPVSEKNISENISRSSTDIETPALATVPAEEPGTTTPAPDPIEVNRDVVLAEPVTEPIDVEVAPREMAGTTEQEATDVHYTQSINEEREKSDMIYFANTSLTKKTKLRGVLRKASRYLERVTSIQ